jgi:hypothetical protein
MTPKEMDQDVEEAQTYLSVTTLRADRCRHESITETTLWFYDATGNQIGAASRLPSSDSEWARQRNLKWEVTRMLNGQPVARKCVASLLDVIGDMMAYEPCGSRRARA